MRTLIIVCVISLSFCSSCTLTTTGGYLVGEGNNPLFEGVHATVAETLTPTLNSNNCFLRKAGQVRQYTLSGELVEVYSVEVSNRMSQKYVFANYCK